MRPGCLLDEPKSKLQLLHQRVLAEATPGTASLLWCWGASPGRSLPVHLAPVPSELQGKLSQHYLIPDYRVSVQASSQEI